MKLPLLILMILFSFKAYAQKGIESLSKLKIDSLRGERVDTIIWYHSYCGECEILNPPGKQVMHLNCTVLSGYELTNNLILYKQKGNYFVIKFDCRNSTIKKQIDTCRSIPYFLSIIPTLIARDKAIRAIYKKGKILGPLQVDGGFEEAEIYLNKTKKQITMSDTEEEDNVYKKYFWIAKQTKLLKLIAKDTQ